MVRLGVITIGQTPRVDLTPELQGLLPDVELVERGRCDAFDELNASDHVLPSGGSANAVCKMAATFDLAVGTST